MDDDNFVARMRLAYRVGVLEALLKMAGVDFPAEAETNAAHDGFMARALERIHEPPTSLELALRASVQANEVRKRGYPCELVGQGGDVVPLPAKGA